MKIRKRYTHWFKRKTEGRTDYKLRLRLLSSRQTRLVVRRSLGGMVVQFVNYRDAGDHVLVCANIQQLRRSYGWQAHGGNIPAAYLIGYLAGLQAKKCGVTSAVLDLGLFKVVPRSRIFAVVKGVLDAGVIVPVAEDALPREDRLYGEHIAAYAPHALGSQFSIYKKKGLNPAGFSTYVREVKEKIHHQWQ